MKERSVTSNEKTISNLDLKRCVCMATFCVMQPPDRKTDGYYLRHIQEMRENLEKYIPGTSFPILISDQIEGNNSFIDRLQETNHSRLLDCLVYSLSQEEILTILNNPDASVASRAWAKRYSLQNIANLDDLTLLNPRICLHILEHSDKKHYDDYHTILVSRKLFKKYVVTILPNDTLTLFYFLSRYKINHAKDSCCIILGILSRKSASSDHLQSIRQILLDNKMKLLGLIIYMDDPKLLKLLIGILGRCSPQSGQPLESPALFKSPITIYSELLCSRMKNGMLPLQYAANSTHSKAFLFLLNAYCIPENRLNIIEGVFDTIIIRRGSVFVHLNILHLICAMGSKTAAELIFMLHHKFKDDINIWPLISRKLSVLNYDCCSPMDMVCDRVRLEELISKMNIMKSNCQRVIVLEIEKTIVVSSVHESLASHPDYKIVKNKAYLYPNLVSSLMRYAKFKGCYIYIVDFFDRSSLELGAILGELLQSSCSNGLDMIDGCMCGSVVREYDEFLIKKNIPARQIDTRKYFQAEFLATRSGLDLTQEFLFLESHQLLVDAINAHGHKAIKANMLQGDPSSIIELANLCGLAEENIEDYANNEPMLAVIKTLRSVECPLFSRPSI